MSDGERVAVRVELGVRVGLGVREQLGLLVAPAAQAPQVHARHVAFDAAPTAADQVPAGHSVQLEPFTFANAPAGHMTGSLVVVHKYPAGHFFENANTAMLDPRKYSSPSLLTESWPLQPEPPPKYPEASLAMGIFQSSAPVDAERATSAWPPWRRK